MVEDGGELVTEVLGDDLPGLAELLVEPLRRGVVAEVAVDNRLRPGVVGVAGQRGCAGGAAKTAQIYEGTNQVQRIVMARQLLAGVQSEL